MKSSTITVLKIEPGQPPIVKEVGNDLKSLQAEVEGLIECIYIGENEIAVVNEEGKLNGMLPNRRMGSDIICGPFFICGDDGEDFTSLSKENISKYSQFFSEIPAFTGQEPELEPRMTFTTFD